MASLDDIERRIAELEREVGGEDDESEDQEQNVVEDAEDREGEEDEQRPVLLPIPPLPPNLLPPAGLYLSTVKREKANNESNNQKSAKTSDSKRVECSACCESFVGDEAFRKHTKTLKHRQNVILRAGAAYEPARHEANFCRACNLKFETVESLLAHRKTAEHKDATEKLARASYCQLCKKQFTSPVQLRGHVLGKAHNDLIERKTGYRPVPLTDKQQASAATAEVQPNHARKRADEEIKHKRQKRV
jgi:hypothetical protein